MIYINYTKYSSIGDLISPRVDNVGTKNRELQCDIYRRIITYKYMQSNVDGNLKPTENGVIACFMSCAREYEKKLPYQGKPIQQFSRITGYYQSIGGWNEGKIQELRDRRRYRIR